MAIFKNVSGQYLAVYAHDTAADAPKTGDAANITAQITLEGNGTPAATNDTNPTELDATDHPGIYVFTLTQAETNANLIILSAVSSTDDVSIEPLIQSTFPAYAQTMVAQTGDSYARLGAPAGASVSADVAAVKAETATILADTNELQTDWVNGGRLDLIVDAILADTGELQTDWVNGGRLDLIVDAILADTNELQTDWADGGRLDLIVDAILVDTGTTLDGKIDTIDGIVDSILADTGTDGVKIATGQTITALTITTLTVTNNAIAWNASWDAEVQSEVADALTAFGWSSITIDTTTNLTNAPTSGDLTATMKASVNTEVVDALNVDTYAEPGQGAPAATASLVAKIGYIYKAWRNKKTQTASQYSLYADDTTTIDQKATVSDDGTTTTVGEVATGP